jgi:hypothetical protein
MIKKIYYFIDHSSIFSVYFLFGPGLSSGHAAAHVNKKKQQKQAINQRLYWQSYPVLMTYPYQKPLCPTTPQLTILGIEISRLLSPPFTQI